MKQSITITLNAWIICGVLLLANLITIGLWRPWSGVASNARTIVITGTSTIESEPDQYVFTPYYQKDGTDKAAVNTEFSNLSKTIVAKLKALGLKDSAIKVDVNLYDYGVYGSISSSEPESNAVATMTLTITVRDKDLAQEVQDYLVTTLPSGSITPQISFSSAKQKVLETQARNEALKDAKSKAEASVKELGARLGRVVAVSDITSGGITPMPWMVKSGEAVSNSSNGSDTSTSYAIQPGLNNFDFQIQVTYEIN